MANQHKVLLNHNHLDDQHIHRLFIMLIACQATIKLGSTLHERRTRHCGYAGARCVVPIAKNFLNIGMHT